MKGHLNDEIRDVYVKLEKNISHKLKNIFTLTEEKKLTVRNLVQKIKIKWQEVNRAEERFLIKFEEWLSKFVLLAEKPE